MMSSSGLGYLKCPTVPMMTFQCRNNLWLLFLSTSLYDKNGLTIAPQSLRSSSTEDWA